MTYPVIYRKSGPPGQSKGPVIWIREDMRSNISVLEHEITHVKQWAAMSALGILWALACYYTGHFEYMSLGLIALVLHPLLYAALPPFRQWCEVQAFKTQVAYGGDLLSCATALSQDYGLKLTQDEALALLKG